MLAENRMFRASIRSQLAKGVDIVTALENARAHTLPAGARWPRRTGPAPRQMYYESAPAAARRETSAERLDPMLLSLAVGTELGARLREAWAELKTLRQREQAIKTKLARLETEIARRRRRADDAEFDDLD